MTTATPATARAPVISQFAPHKGYPGTMLKIYGSNFAATRQDNFVTVGGRPALVVQATATLLEVITDLETATGLVEVKTGVHTATSPHPFKALPSPSPHLEVDGSPILFEGNGFGQQGDVPSTGTLNVLVVLMNPTDRMLPDATVARNAVVQSWDNVHTYYDQASYSRLNVHVDVTATWHTLSGTFNDYIQGDNIAPAALPRLFAESAQLAVNDGFNLDNYQVMACIVNLNGTFIRAWGGFFQSNFSFTGNGLNINITTGHNLGLLAIQESADWGRFAHELGHDIITHPPRLDNSPGAATLGEDVYGSDLVDPNEATAQSFDIMGNHDSHPLFSAFHIETLGYYNPTNILNLQWDRNPFSQEYEVAAHGLTQNAVGGRYHLLKIKVAEGLFYYVEVRQQPGATTQVFDRDIPLDGTTRQGGVVVTKVFTDTVNLNQQMRFITLLHDPHVLKQGDVATDPLRTLKITVVSDTVATNPLVCRVRVEWAQGIADDPNGAFDLRIEPWDSNWQTPDIWIDRMPFNAFDNPLDAQGRPSGNGDEPRPLETNHFFARIHCDGLVSAKNVRVTYYTVDPPGVGDNGNWAPLQTVVIPNIAANNFVDVNVNWVPVVGEHTCLKVYAEQQLGEITGGDNWAQENVFQFEAPAHSIPAPVSVPVAIRNPLKQRTIVLINIKGVPLGFTAHFPHAWVWMNPLEERQLALTIIPTLDYSAYRKNEILHANVQVIGEIPHSYQELIPPGVFPASIVRAIGGITARVIPKQSVTVKLGIDEERSKGRLIALVGTISPALTGEKLRVDLIDPDDRLWVLETTTNSQGQFHSLFNLTRLPSIESKYHEHEDEKIESGVYTAQALIINSPNAAQTESNIVYIKKEET